MKENVLIRSDSLGSEPSLSPPPKKIFHTTKDIETAVLIVLDVEEPGSSAPGLTTGELAPTPAPALPQLTTTGAVGDLHQVAGHLEAPSARDQGSSQQAGDLAPKLQDLAKDKTSTPQDLTRDQNPAVSTDQALAGDVEAQDPIPMEGYEIQENSKYKEEISRLKMSLQTVRLQHANKVNEYRKEIDMGKSELVRIKKRV